MFDFSIVVFVWYFKGERPPLKLHKSIRERKMKPATGRRTDSQRVHPFSLNVENKNTQREGRVGQPLDFSPAAIWGRAHGKLFF